MQKQRAKWFVTMGMSIIFSLFFLVTIQQRAQAKIIEWSSLGGPLNGDPMAIFWGQGNLSVVARSATDDVLYSKTWLNGSWSDWSSLGGQTVGYQSAISLSENHASIFAQGTDNAVWIKSWLNDSWIEWKSLGGQSKGGYPAVVSWGSNHAAVFILQPDNTIGMKTFLDGSWSEWSSLGGQLAGPPSAVSWGQGHISIVAQGTDNAVWINTYLHGSWTGWYSLGGHFEGYARIVSWGEGHGSVIAKGMDNAVWINTWLEGSWSGWTSLNGKINGIPSVFSKGPNSITIVVRGTDDAVYYKEWNGSWSEWVSVGGQITGLIPEVVSSPNIDIALFGWGPDDALWCKMWVKDNDICLKDDSGNLDIEEAQGKIGDEIRIPVRIQNAPDNVTALGFEVTYDASVLEYVGFESGMNGFAGFFEVFNANKISDSSRLIVGGYTELTGDDEIPRRGILKEESGVLVQLKFKVTGGQKGSCYPLRLENLKDDITNFTKTDGSFSYTECNGDLNRDGEITPADALIAFKCFLQSGPCSDCCDANGDGDITPADALCIFQKYLQIPSCLD